VTSSLNTCKIGYFREKGLLMKDTKLQAREVKPAQVKTVYLRDYQVPEFLFETVELRFELGEKETTVQSRIVVKKNPASKTATSSLVLNGEELELDSVMINKRLLEAAEFQVSETSLTLFGVPESFELEIQVRIKPQENKALSGLYRSGKHFCTQCEAQGFRRITYFLDRPDVLSRFSTTIIANEAQYPILLSNGNPVDAGKLPDGRHWVRWEDPFRKPGYLFALVAGDFDLLEDSFKTASGREVALRIYVEKGYREQCFHAMQAVKKAMMWDEVNYGREYDLDIYMLVGMSDFNMGAMENKGLNIFNTKTLLAAPETATDDDYIYVESVIAHEYFHNWTGNRITCRDWFQLSIKEGLTIFRDQSFTEDTTAKTVARIRDVNALRIRQFPEDAGPLAHPVRPESYVQIDNFYTSTVYNKGAEVARMLRTILGTERFRQAMDLYFTRHDGQAVTIEEFVKVMEEVSGLDLAQFRLWYSQAGTPVLTVSDTYDEKQKTYTLHFKQSCPQTPGQTEKKPMFIPVKMGLLDLAGKQLALELGEGGPQKETVLHIKNTEDKVVFKNVTSRPIPSLLRGFSAPVKMNFHYSDEALASLFKHDADQFNRWEAGQKYAERCLLQLIQDYQQKKPLAVKEDFIRLWEATLKAPPEDKFFLSQLLSLPSERYLAELLPVIDVDAIHEAREFLALTLAKQLKSLWLSLYQELHDPKASYLYQVEEVGKRQLKNLCLHYLMLLPDEALHEKLGMQQFKISLPKNMTDTIGALRCLNNLESPLRAQALQEFYETWQEQPLIVDKWLALQAGSKLETSLAEVKKLSQHPAFDLKNPNKVYSLIGTFVQQNLHRFHAIDGQGYAFLTDCVLKLNQFNPIVAARMVKSYVEWRRYDTKRQKLMKEQLETILQQKKLSKDVYEIVTKSLQEE
jgi:aminopeptidase N